jgi:lysozyme
MDRKPIFDAIAFERGTQPTAAEETRISSAMLKLGVPFKTSPSETAFVPPSGPQGLNRRSVVFGAFRDQLQTLRPLHINVIDDLLDSFGFPLPPLTADPTDFFPIGRTIPIPGSPTRGLASLAPKTKTPTKSAAKVTLISLIGATAALSVNSALDRWEGNKLVPYYDVVKIATNCRGNTKNVDMRRKYTAEECAIINEAQAVAHTTPVIKATPLLTTPTKTQVSHPNQLAAAISFAYNVGTGAYATSSIDRYFDQGYWYTACDSLLLWNKAGGKVVKGLTLRRQWERDLCRTGVPLEYQK